MEIGNSELPPIKQEGSPKKGLVQSAKEWGQNLAGIFNKKLEGERKPGEPKISIHIYFGNHMLADDLRGFKEKLLESDVYIPEDYGWNSNLLHIFRGLSEGRIKPEDVHGDSQPFRERLRELIYNTHKPIAFIDVPAKHPLALKTEELAGKTIFNTINDSFDAIKKSIRKYVKEASRFMDKGRVDFMLKQLKPTVSDLLRDYPYLLNKKEIKVLMTLGVVHTDFFHELKNQSFEASRSFHETPYTYSFYEELVRMYDFGKEATDELVSRVALELCFNELIIKDNAVVTRNSSKEKRFLRRIIKEFSMEEIREIFEGVNSEDEYWNLKKLFEGKLKEKGLSIPKSEQELDAFLAKPLPRKTAG